MFPVFPNFWNTLVFKHERFFKQNVQTDQLSCGCSVEDGDTLPCEGRKCWYPERRNSRSSLNPSHIKYRTKNFQKFHAGEKKVYKISIFGPKKIQLRKLHFVAHAFRFSSFLSRRPFCVCSRRGMAPFLLVSDFYLKNFEERSDEQRHSWIWYASYHQLPGTWKHPFTNGWQSIRWWTKYLHRKWFFNQKSMWKNGCLEYQVGMIRFWALLQSSSLHRNSRHLEFWFAVDPNSVPEKYPLCKWFILDLKMVNANAMRKLMG